MKPITASSAIEAYLEANRWDSNADLIDRVIKEGTDLELQVNVGPHQGELVHGKRNTYTDGVTEWFSFRVPRGAFTDTPNWKDFKLGYNPLKYVSAIGSTGWNWRRQVSMWVGFDFDAITGHAEGVGIEKSELNRVRDACKILDYCEVRSSTGGAGLHIYVHLDEVPTLNHTEHSAIARVVLERMSRDVGFDLAQRVDVCGSNLWVASARATEAAGSFRLLKAADHKFTDIPEDWRSHKDVVARRRSKVKLPGVQGDKEDDLFSRLTSAHRQVPLDDDHNQLMEILAGKGCSVWVQDSYLLQTHTALLKEVLEEDEMETRGVFETNSPGTNRTEPNCFMFPLDDGAWRVFRFGQGTVEHTMWNQDGSSWTSTTFNTPPDLDTALSARGAKKLKSGNYSLPTLKEAIEVVKLVSGNPHIDIPATPEMLGHKAQITKDREGKIHVAVKHFDKPHPSWDDETKKDYQSFSTEVSATSPQQLVDYDSIIRCLQTPMLEPAGWSLLDRNGQWVQKTQSAIKTVLQSLGHVKPEAEVIIGKAEYQPWTLVSIPFAPEYPGGRTWNRDRPTYAIDPVPYDMNGEEPSKHPHWDMVLDHLGKSLDPILKHLDWAQESGVVSGRQYLECWIASAIRHPFDALPYLFMVGEQNSGKSTLQEALPYIVEGGVVLADRCLIAEFNSELEGAVFAIIEERDLSKGRGVYDRIKALVTNDSIAIRAMRKDVYTVRNSTHWIQLANSSTYCPLQSGDTRVTALSIDPLEREIPKLIMQKNMEAEAGYFLYTLLNVNLPQPSGRLRLPVVETELKQSIVSTGLSVVDKFLYELCEPDPDGKILNKEFHTRMDEWHKDNFSGKGMGLIKMGQAILESNIVDRRVLGANKLYVTGWKWKEGDK